MAKVYYDKKNNVTLTITWKTITNKPNICNKDKILLKLHKMWYDKSLLLWKKQCNINKNM